jgi:hypothetical protein
MTRKNICTCLVQTHFFNISDPQLVEFMDAEPMNTQGQPRMISVQSIYLLKEMIMLHWLNH